MGVVGLLVRPLDVELAPLHVGYADRPRVPETRVVIADDSIRGESRTLVSQCSLNYTAFLAKADLN